MSQIEQAGLPHLHTFHVNTCIVNQHFKRVHDGRTRFWQLKAARISERKLGGLPAWRRRTKSLQVQVRPIDCKTAQDAWDARYTRFQEIMSFLVRVAWFKLPIVFYIWSEYILKYPWSKFFGKCFSSCSRFENYFLSLNCICMHKNYLSGGDLCSIVHYGLVFEQSPQK